MKLSLALNSTRLARFWMVLVTSFKVRSAVALGGSAQGEASLQLIVGEDKLNARDESLFVAPRRRADAPQNVTSLLRNSDGRVSLCSHIQCFLPDTMFPT